MRKSNPLPIVLRNREPVIAPDVPLGEYDPTRSISVVDGMPLVELAKSRTAVTKTLEGVDQSEVCDAEISGNATLANSVEEDLGNKQFEFGGTTTTRTLEGIDQPEASEIMNCFDETVKRTAISIDANNVASLGLHEINRTSITATRESIDQSECVNNYYD